MVVKILGVSASRCVQRSSKQTDHKATSMTRIHKDVLFSNTLGFMEEVGATCLDIETQEIARWALTPWSSSEATVLVGKLHSRPNSRQFPY